MLIRLIDFLQNENITVMFTALCLDNGLLELTDEGRERHARAFEVITDCNRRIGAGVPEGEVRKVARLLTAIIRNQTSNPATLASLLDFARA